MKRDSGFQIFSKLSLIRNVQNGFSIFPSFPFCEMLQSLYWELFVANSLLLLKILFSDSDGSSRNCVLWSESQWWTIGALSNRILLFSSYSLCIAQTGSMSPLILCGIPKRQSKFFYSSKISLFCIVILFWHTLLMYTCFLPVSWI